MSDFTGPITAPCVCDECGSDMPSPTLALRCGGLRWLSPCCEACKTAAYNTGVDDGKFEAARGAEKEPG